MLRPVSDLRCLGHLLYAVDIFLCALSASCGIAYGFHSFVFLVRHVWLCLSPSLALDQAIVHPIL